MENTVDGHRLQLPYPQSFGFETHQSLETYGLHEETPLVCMPFSGAKTPFSNLTVTEPYNGPYTFDISSLFSPDQKPVPASQRRVMDDSIAAVVGENVLFVFPEEIAETQSSTTEEDRRRKNKKKRVNVKKCVKVTSVDILFSDSTRNLTSSSNDGNVISHFNNLEKWA
ncbi:hypothetical protein Bca52824_025252 [Brassica carinata]|uniref:Uncharacterized protein n=1 Tax=Brassica carinata TaxID=52824 RepID=A0A8X7VMT3_BRACI|nr:hypothetical protein Bca52824_025252 [Brassica carinata]